MEFEAFVRKPFVVQAVEITEDNIAELAPLIGSLKKKEDESPYILVNRKKVPNVIQVFPGWWMTKMGKNIRCYNAQVFEREFIKSNASLEGWVQTLNDKTPPTVAVNG